VTYTTIAVPPTRGSEDPRQTKSMATYTSVCIALTHRRRICQTDANYPQGTFGMSVSVLRRRDLPKADSLIHRGHKSLGINGIPSLDVSSPNSECPSRSLPNYPASSWNDAAFSTGKDTRTAARLTSGSVLTRPNDFLSPRLQTLITRLMGLSGASRYAMLSSIKLFASHLLSQLYLVENFKHAFDMDSYIYYTQIMQAETLASAYRLWRRNWKGEGRAYTAGALVWQVMHLPPLCHRFSRWVYCW
jgi:hypothetical protein